MSSTDNPQISKNVVFPKQNPLLISLVLENILNQSEWSFEDLKSMRLVCKLWHDYTLPRWRSTATVCLLQERRPSSRRKGCLVKHFAEILRHSHGNNGNDPLQLKKIPFRKYKLFNWRFDGRNNYFTATWDRFGTLIEQLILERCTFDGEESKLFNYMVYIGSPELRHLVMDSCQNVNEWIRLCSARNTKIHSLEVTKWMPFKEPGKENYEYESFLKSFPRLKTLKMSEMAEEFLTDSPEEWRPVDELMEITRNNFFLHQNLTPELLPHLRELDIMHWNLSPESEFDITDPLEELKFPLESLSLSLNSYCNIGQEFSQILTSHSGTLRVLKIFVAPHNAIQLYTLEHCDDLLIEELELWGNVLADFAFLMKMPKLKKLKMDYGAFDKWKFMEKAYAEKAVYPVTAEDIMEQTFRLRDQIKPTDFVVMDNLTEFHIDVKFGPQEIKLFPKWMPNLRSFKSVFDRYNFRILLRDWRNMKNLRELHALYGSELDDFAICGFEEDKHYPNITWLKDLRHFSSEAYCNEGWFSDESVTNGFLKTNLSSIKISVSPEFSVEMEQRLKESIGHVQVLRNYGDHTGECCRRLLFMKKALVPKDTEGVERSDYHLLTREELTEAGSLICHE